MNKKEFIDFLKKTEKAYRELANTYKSSPEKRFYDGKADATKYIISEMDENLTEI